MIKRILPEYISEQVAELYHDMETGYDEIAKTLDFGCQGCPDNCCDSYFQHHTYTEWAYLWEGLQAVPADKKERFIRQAEEYVKECDKSLAKNERPAIMCPINIDGLCGLYPHRMMICRLHGIPSSMTRPDGQKMEFPGCFRCQQIVEDKENIPHMDRTKMYQRLVQLEMDWLGQKRRILPRVKMTLAQMIVKGPPDFINFDLDL